jgi:enamine deaminase RidA (YjgF/YER057c/UK114 family)
MNIEDKLRQMGVTLPEPPKPVASYVPCARSGNLVFVSGQIARESGVLRYSGKVGAERNWEEGYQAARLCALNALSALKQELGTLDRIRRVVKLTGYVASASGFTDQPKVVDGASKLIVELFGEQGQHARAAVGVSELPLGSTVELEVVVEVESEPRA